jgi:hypothetical protein
MGSTFQANPEPIHSLSRGAVQHPLDTGRMDPYQMPIE